jgi:hypothetical protein
MWQFGFFLEASSDTGLMGRVFVQEFPTEGEEGSWILWRVKSSVCVHDLWA